MKKIVLSFLSVCLALVLSSCKPDNGFIYNVTVTGDVGGDVVLTFPNGMLNLTGESTLDFAYSNDTQPVVDSLVNSDPVTIGEFAENVASSFDVTLKESTAEGHYHVVITGYAKDPTTGITVSIDKEFQYPVPLDVPEAE